MLLLMLFVTEVVVEQYEQLRLELTDKNSDASTDKDEKDNSYKKQEVKLKPHSELLLNCMVDYSNAHQPQGTYPKIVHFKTVPLAAETPPPEYL
jgi:hypothetical protein